MSDTHAITKVQLVTGDILETNPLVHIEALQQRTRIEQVVSEPKIDPTVRFPHTTGYRILAAAHIVQTWTETVTLTPASRPDAEA